MDICWFNYFNKTNFKFKILYNPENQGYGGNQKIGYHYAIKNNYSSVGSKGARGYTPKGIETAVGESVPDQKEFWHHGPQIDPSFDQRIPANLIIKEVPDFNKNFDNHDFTQLYKLWQNNIKN